MEQMRYEQEINFNQLLFAIWRKRKKIVFVGLIMAIALMGCKSIISGNSMNTKTAKVNVTDYAGISNIFCGSTIDIATSEAIRTYLTGNYILNRVIDDTKINISYDKLYSMISLSESSATNVKIVVIGDDKEIVQKIINSITSIGVSQIASKFKNSEVTNLDTVRTFSRQYNKVKTFFDNTYITLLKQIIKYLVIGFVVGVLLSSGFFLLIFLFDNTIKNDSDVNTYLGIPVLANIPSIKEKELNIVKNKKIRKERLNQSKS